MFGDHSEDARLDDVHYLQAIIKKIKNLKKK